MRHDIRVFTHFIPILDQYESLVNLFLKFLIFSYIRGLG